MTTGSTFERGRAWFVATELQIDIVVEIEGVRICLHKFPLLSKSGLLNRLVFESRDSQKNDIQLDGIPGGAAAFELAAKFCYGMRVDLNSFNVAAVWCAAEYLEMTEDHEVGNLISKAENFFNVVTLSSLKDSVTVLQSCENLFPWADKLQIVQRCIESIAWKACTDPRGLRSNGSSRMASRTQSPTRNRKESDISNEISHEWWFDDVLLLPVEFFTRVMGAMKVKGIRPRLLGAAVTLYAVKWLADASIDDYRPSSQSRKRAVFEQILSVLPQAKDSVPIKCLLLMIRSAQILKTDVSYRLTLEQRAGLQLERATLSDLLIPTSSSAAAPNFETKFDVDLVHRILQIYLKQQQQQQQQDDVVSFGDGFTGKIAGRIKVANLLDSYLLEISADPNLSVRKFVTLAEALPDATRRSHDVLYTAIDVFLKAHPYVEDEERKEVCQVLDCRKLSLKYCMHAAQNESLPVRTVMQVLFFKHKQHHHRHHHQRPHHHSDHDDGDGDGDAAAMQKEIRSIRYELEKMKSEFIEFQKQHPHRRHHQQQGLLKKLSKSLHSFTSAPKSD